MKHRFTLFLGLVFSVALCACTKQSVDLTKSANTPSSTQATPNPYPWVTKGKERKKTDEFRRLLALVQQWIDQGKFKEADESLKKVEAEYKGFFYEGYIGEGDGSLDEEISRVRAYLSCRREQGDEVRPKSLDEFGEQLEKALTACSVDQLTKLVGCRGLFGPAASDVGWRPASPRVAATQVVDSICTSGKLRGTLKRLESRGFLFQGAEAKPIESIQDTVLKAQFDLDNDPVTGYGYFDFIYSHSAD